MQIPRLPGGQPGTYLQPLLGVGNNGISTLDPTPLYPFGFGRGYTRFEIDGLETSADEIGTDGEVRVSVRVTNTGERAGDEVVQLYLHDPVARVTRPVLQLAGFARVPLQPLESRTVTFTSTPTGPPTRAGTSSGSSRRATCTCSSAARPPTCPAAPCCASSGPTGSSAPTARWSPR